MTRGQKKETANKKDEQTEFWLLDSRFQTASRSATSACKHQRFTHCAISIHPLLCSPSIPLFFFFFSHSVLLSHNLCSSSFLFPSPFYPLNLWKTQGHMLNYFYLICVFWRSVHIFFFNLYGWSFLLFFVFLFKTKSYFCFIVEAEQQSACWHRCWE